jgi:hypothetical protein
VFAYELLRAGANLRQTQELLGDKHLDSTQRYTRVTAYQLCGVVKRLRFAGEPLRPTMQSPADGQAPRPS